MIRSGNIADRIKDLPRGEDAVQIIVTGEDLHRLIRILHVVTGASVPGIHETEELGGELGAARKLLSSIVTSKTMIDRSKAIGAIRDWASNPDGLWSEDLGTLSRVAREAGIEVTW